MSRGIGRFVWHAALATLAGTVMFGFAAVPMAHAEERLAANCGPRTSGALSGSGYWAQTFTSQLSGPLTRAEVAVLKQGDPGDYEVQIRAVDASAEPTGTVLATDTVPDASVPDGEATVTALFGSPPTVAAGQNYAVSISRPDSDTNAIGTREGCPHQLMFSFDGSSFSPSAVPSPESDLVFSVFVEVPAEIPSAQGSCRGRQATHLGTDGNDEITGTPGRDVIAALGGKDEVSGLAGKDLICGGKGRDTLRGGKGKDKLYGQGGKDKLAGGGGKDRCNGGKKDDTAKKCEVEKSI